MTRRPFLLVVMTPLITLLFPSAGIAFSGTEGASFLELPTGARPAAMGGAYSALATDAYAPTINPGGLGYLRHSELSGMHVIYVEDTSYEFASFVQPLGEGKALGAAIQYFRPGSVERRNPDGDVIGDFAGGYGAYSLSYGQKVWENVALGVNGKFINAKIDDVSASAYAVDAGTLWQATEHLSLAGVVQNVGSKLKFLSEGDSLPMAARLGAAYKLKRAYTFSAEGVYRKSGVHSAHVGVEWKNEEGYSMRGGYSTERIRALSALAGLSLGVGLALWGHELAYTWVPLGDFGHSHYISMIFRWGPDVRHDLDENGSMQFPENNANDSLLDDSGTESQGLPRDME